MEARSEVNVSSDVETDVLESPATGASADADGCSAESASLPAIGADRSPSESSAGDGAVSDPARLTDAPPQRDALETATAPQAAAVSVIPVQAEPRKRSPAPAPDLDGVARGIREPVADPAERIGELADALAELSRLRSRDTDLIDRLHEEVTRLRTGEIATAINPLVTGMIKLHDQMVSLGALDDPASPVGMLHTQLLQTLELTCAVKPLVPALGEQFNASRHTGTRRIATADPRADGTIATTIKVGFVRADGSVVRVAEVEVHRLSS